MFLCALITGNSYAEYIPFLKIDNSQISHRANSSFNKSLITTETKGESLNYFQIISNSSDNFPPGVFDPDTGTYLVDGWLITIVGDQVTPSDNKSYLDSSKYHGAHIEGKANYLPGGATTATITGGKITVENGVIDHDLKGSYASVPLGEVMTLNVGHGSVEVKNTFTDVDIARTIVGNSVDTHTHIVKVEHGQVDIANSQFTYWKLYGNQVDNWGNDNKVNNGNVNIINSNLNFTANGALNALSGIRGNYVLSQLAGVDYDQAVHDGHILISNSTIGSLKPENEYPFIEGTYIRGKGQNLLVARNSSVIVENSSYVKGIITANKIWQATNATCEYGIISVSGSQIDGSLYGGYIDYPSATILSSATAKSSAEENYEEGISLSKTNHNKITIKNSTIQGEIISGGFSTNWLGDAEALDNTIHIENSSIKNSIYGALVKFDTQLGIGYGKATASDNVISIIGKDNIIGDVTGAYANVANSSTAIITNNKIELLDASGAEFTKANLKGYDYTLNDDPKSELVAEGNTLLVQNWTGKVNSINNFNMIEFKGIKWKNEGVVLEVLNDGQESNLNDTEIHIAGSTTVVEGEELHVGDYMYFLHTDEGHDFQTNKVNPAEGVDGNFTVLDGVAFEGTGEVIVEEGTGNVKYEITGVKNSDQAEEVPERQSASQAFVLQTNDLVVDGLNAVERDQLLGTRLFAIGEGAYSKYDVSDKLKIHGWNGMVGAGGVKQNDESDLAWAGFFEFGDANSRFWYDIGDIHHRTNAEFHYRGFGLALRERYDNGWYWDASGRAGIIHTESENAFMAGAGDFYDSDIHTTYFSFHLGGGRVIPMENNRNLDLFVRFFYTQFDGEDFDIAGDRFVIDKAESKQLRTGGRWSFKLDQPMNFYLGAALEYEFDGDSNGSVNGHALRETSLGGATGYGEFGFKYRKEVESPWDYEGRIRGYFGVREGVSGVLRATYTF